MVAHIRYVPRRIAGLYAAFGMAWILLSDLGLNRLGLSPQIELTVQTWKGWLYVLVSAALIYGLVRHASSRLAEQAARLAQSETRYRLLFDDNPYPLLAYDLDDLGIVAANAAMAEALGYAPDELLRMSPRDLLEPDDRARFFDMVERFRREGGDSAGRWRVRHRSGTLLYFDVRSHAIEIDGRRARLLQAKDVTAQLAAEASLIDLSEQLASASAEIRDLGQAAAHHLQQPLRQVVSHLQLLAKRCDGLDGDAREFLGFAIDGALRMKTSLDDIVQLTGMDPEPPEFTDIGLVATEVAAAFRPRLEILGGRIAVDPLPVLPARRRHMRLLFHHLFDNAVKFRSAGRPPEIRVTGEQRGGCWTIRIGDNGIGIAPEHHLDAFSAFRRVHGDPTLPGNGVGLAVCKKIVEQHGGRIQISSQPDQGCVVSFTLPMG